jgi:hypothetical protein
MSTQDGGHRKAAVGALAAREYARAGDEYTRAGRRVLADPRPGRDPFAPDEQGWVGDGVCHLVTGALAYRVAGRDGRAVHRGVEGAAVARDLTDALDRPVQRACLTEFVADCRVAGGLEGVADAYDEAAEAYEDTAVDDPRRWTTTPLFEAAATPLQQVARGLADGEIAVTWEDLHGRDPANPGAFLAHRARYKKRRFPGLVERAVDRGHLAAPRGTTEYDNASYRCPACGSTDVNWTADRTLCLRCSTPVERR